MRSYKHLQTTPATVWTVSHNFGVNPVSDVFINNDGALEKILPLSVVVIDQNTLQVNFTNSQTGEVRTVST